MQSLFKRAVLITLIQGKMKNETDGESNTQERENQLETSHNKSPLLPAAWKPYQRPRAIIKGQTEVEKSIETDQC